MKYFLFVLCLVAIASGTKFEDCGSDSGKVEKIEVSDCPDSDDTCILKKDAEMVIKIPFEAKKKISYVKAIAMAYIDGRGSRLSGPSKNGCSNSGLQCPLEAGKSYTYQSGLQIKKDAKPVKMVIQWKLTDDSGSTIACVKFKAEIK